MADQDQKSRYVELAADIIVAYVSNNVVQRTDLPALITEVHDALKKAKQAASDKPQEQLTPAVPIKKSVTPDYIICLDDGKKFKSLKRHLRSSYDLTPDQYRTRWGLPSDYPMVAPNYAKARSELATQMGLGLKRKGSRKGARKRSVRALAL